MKANCREAAQRKVAISIIIVMVVVLIILAATITPVNFTNVLAQDPVLSLTPRVYLPYVSRQGSATSEPISTPPATSTATATHTAMSTDTPTSTATSTETATPTNTPTATATATDTPTAVPEECNVHEPNDVPDQANTIAEETQTDCVLPETDVDWWVFSVTTESEVIIEVLGDGGSGDLYVKLYDNDLDVIESDIGWNGTDVQIDRFCGTRWVTLSAGTYYISVEDYSNNYEIVPYDISLAVTPCPSAVVLANHSSYITLDFSPSLIVVGEIQNNGILGIMEPRIVVNLFDDNNQLIDTAIAYTHLARYSWQDSALGAGDKTCFQAEFSEFNGWSYYEFETPTYDSIGDPLQNMTISDDNGTYDSGDGSYRILGFVRNDDDVTVTDVDLIGTLYDASSTVVGCDITSANNDNLAPGQSSSFELTFSGYYRDYADVDSYRLQVDGIAQ